jgi:hypothetical protein
MEPNLYYSYYYYFVCVCVVLEFELKAYTLSHSASPFLGKVFFFFFEIGCKEI